MKRSIPYFSITKTSTFYKFFDLPAILQIRRDRLGDFVGSDRNYAGRAINGTHAAHLTIFRIRYRCFPCISIQPEHIAGTADDTAAAAGAFFQLPQFHRSQRREKAGHAAADHQYVRADLRYRTLIF